MQQLNTGEIYLNEANHEYIFTNGEKADFTSCTTFIDYFFKPFDRIGIANNLVMSHPKYKGKNPRDLIDAWNKSAADGTAIHAEIENYIKNGIAPLLPKSEAGVQWIKRYMNDSFEIISEAIVFSRELKLAGTVDLIILNKKTGEYELFDWKTNRKIETSAYGGRTGITSATRHLPDCNYYHYSLQLSLYRYLLEKFYGIQISSQTILHLNGGGVTPYKADYLKREIEEMLKFDRENLKHKSEKNLTKEFIR